MAKNTRALTDDELKYINDNYLFELKDDLILVSFKGYNRKTVHSVHEPFSINAKPRLVKITQKAIDLWVNKYLKKYSLIEVQAAINRLTVTYQDLTDVEISQQLEKTHENIK